MNWLEAAIRRIDEWQQRHTGAAYAVAVVKKYGDDQAGNLVALITYYGFLAVFPLLLAASSILGLVLAHHPALQHRLTRSALTEFPIIGPQLQSQVGVSSLHHSVPGVVIGLLGAIYGARGLANAVQNMLNTAWAVPKVDRPGFPANLVRGLALLALLAVGVAATAGAATLAAFGRQLGLDGVALQGAAFGVSAALYSALFWLAFRIGTAGAVGNRELLLGAVLAGVAWRVLLALAGLIVTHYLRHAQSVAGLFGIVLGLLAWLALQATVTVYAVEADVVRARRLWPRGIVQPPLTPADERTLRLAAKTEVRRPEERVGVRFRRSAARTPDTAKK
jgi:YihY family inner membrane protein